MNNLNKVVRILKSNLKNKLSITKQTIILFLMMGMLGISEVISDNNKDSLHIGTVANNGRNNILVGDVATPGNYSIIFATKNGGGWHGNGKYKIAFGDGVNADGDVEYGIIFGNVAGHALSGKYKFIFGEAAGFRNNGEYNFAFGKASGRVVNGIYNFAFGNEAGQDIAGGNNISLLQGAGSQTNGHFNMAVGFQAGQITRGNYNYAFGPQSGKNTTGDENIAIGSHAGKDVSGNANYAFGRSAGQNVSGLGNIAFGENAGQNVKGLPNNEILGYSNVAIGKESGRNVISNQSLALGYRTGGHVGYVTWDNASNDFTANPREYVRNSETNPNGNIKSGAEHNTAVGANSGNYIAGQDNVALGEGAGNYIDGPEEGGAGNVGIGRKAGNRIYGNDNIALGANSSNRIKGSNNIGIGTSSSNQESYLIEKENTISMGTSADSIANNAISIGTNAKTFKIDSITIGKDSQNSGEKSIIVGSENTITSDKSGIFGYKNYVSYNPNIHVIGNNNGDFNNQISAQNGGIFGNNNKLPNTAINSRIIGNNNEITINDGFIVGNESKISGSHTVAFGNNINAKESQSVYLGFNSDFNSDSTKSAGNTTYSSYNLTDKNGVVKKTFDFAAPVPVGITTIGSINSERRLQNVAAGLIGPNSTDAINGSQLYALADYVANLENQVNNTSPVKVVDGKNTSVTTGDDKGTTTYSVDVSGDLTEITSISNEGTKISLEDENKVNVNGATITNVSAGKADTDAVNVSQLNELKTQINNNTTTINNIENKISKTELTVDNGKVVNLDDENKDKLVSANTVKDAINNTGFFINSDRTFGENIGSKKTLVKAGEEVKLIAGRNVTISQNGKNFEISVDRHLATEFILIGEDGIIAETVTENGRDIITVKSDKSEIISKKGGEAKTTKNEGLVDGITVVNAINALGNNTISLSGNTGNTDSQNLNKENGITFGIKGKGLVTTEANGNEILIDLTDETKEKINNIEKGAKSASTAANAGVASAVAMANLPQVSNIAGHRHNIAGAYGYYNGEHAFALGLSGLNETGNLVYKASGSLNTKGHIALGAGLGYQFDKLESRRKDMLTLQRNGNINLLDEKVYELDKEVNDLKTSVKYLEMSNKELKEENLKLNNRLEELENIVRKSFK
ncbi:YadA-like family protein [Streptobacillus felis]|uniref:YadA-like family protein n=1 Tax=Streptobacillus felis TaxID=1384509 RepID=A0A7Z0T7K2_9FUSO|nr:YadA-like family protein [Streptobacillus felis]NYV28371.1 YadA-like family protein [Streptobacillus felis]